MSDGNNILSFRLRWYRQNFLAFLRRYQHALFLVVFTTIPIAGNSDFIFAILAGVAQPVLSVIDTNGMLLFRLLTLMAVQVGFTVWIVLQKNAVLGNPLTRYLMTLPISESQRWNLNLGVLLRGNNIAWLVFVAAIAYIVQAKGLTIDSLQGILNIFSIVCLVLFAQILWFYRSLFVAFVLLFIDCIYLSSGLLFDGLGAIALSLVALVALLTSLIAFPHVFGAYLWMNVSAGKQRIINPTTIKPGKRSSLLSIFNIYLKILFDSYVYSTILRLFIGLLISLFIVIVLRQSGLTISAGYLAFFFSVISFIASETFSVLIAERKKILLLLDSLPIRSWFWYLVDSFIVFYLVLIMSAPVVVYLAIKKMISATNILEMSIYLVLLVSTLFFVRSNLEKQGAVASATICIAGTLGCFGYVG